MLADVACMVLNLLPARYVRHYVEMMFYLTEQEREVIDVSVNDVFNRGCPSKRINTKPLFLFQTFRCN
jgi:hypothetical protein